MTLSTTTNRVSYDGDGSTTEFPFVFKFLNKSAIKVVLRDALGVETKLIITTHYTLTDPADSGTVTMNSAPALGETLVIYREVALTQTYDPVEGGSFPVDAAEDAWDKGMMALQQLSEEVGRSPLLKVSSAYGDRTLVLPEPSENPNRLIGFDVGGDQLTTYAMQTVYAANIDSIRNYNDSLATAITQIGAAQKTLMIDKTITITTNLTVPANIHLWVLKGCTIDGAYNLTINGAFEAGHYQVFGSSITIIFKDGSVEKVHPEWWNENLVPGTTDMTTAFQSAIDSLKALPVAGIQAPPLVLAKSTYLITSSLNVTFAAAYNAGISIIGQGRYATRILGTLGEAYPVIDFTGNTYGKLKDIWVDADSGSATACLLAASPAAAGNAGNNIRIAGCFLQMAYDAPGAALVGYNSDLISVRNTEMRGGQGATWGLGKPATVSSKFVGSLHAGDSTSGMFDNCIFLSDVRVPFTYTGGATCALRDCYMALVGTGAGLSCIEVNSPSGTGGNTLYAYNLRTENQSSAETTNAILFTSSSPQGGHIDGALNNEVMIKIENEKILGRYDLNIIEPENTNPLFAGAGVAIECTIKTNAANYGTLGSASHGNIFIGDIDLPEGTPNNERNLIYKDTVWYDNRNTRFLPPGQSSTYMRQNSSFGLVALSTAYQTPGEMCIGIINIPADMLTQPDGPAPKINLAIKIVGDTIGGNAGGRIRLELDDGTNTQEILDHTSVPAGAGSVEIDVTILNVSADSLRTIVKSDIAGGIVTKYTNMGASPITVAAAMDLKVYETNDIDNGIRVHQAIRSLV